MPNLKKLRLERVTPWMTNDDLIILTQGTENLVELSLLGCRLLNPDSLDIISKGWPGLISIHLEVLSTFLCAFLWDSFFIFSYFTCN
uniref:BTB/POZ domain-containing protein FBL11 isoform X3 n=1 Tax=Rhizophora mucronata TaxID=61149 RepID=A0A2P2LXA7_RHIMU